ncbi:hypothetical protein [Metabacillus fastidiosus]|uniref:hypothetical protein n=1 Tax=Metabacillus fastidiosus TaxID=1458 RepID=UPI002DBA5500|nr:hypothetical protein [Metabacillus fastidiosus]MEC2074579.1 hypothetical protein [Metabacillus fastidiosus]
MELDRSKILYSDVKKIRKNNVVYHVDVYGHGNYYATYAGMFDGDNYVCKYISRSEEEAIEKAILEYELSKLPN